MEEEKKLQANSEQPKKKKAFLESKDLETNTGMKMVFITASPVLTNEVKRFYTSIKAKLVAHLRKKEEESAKAEAKDDFQTISEQEA